MNDSHAQPSEMLELTERDHPRGWVDYEITLAASTGK
jgi:hypothetical protein